MCSQAEREMGGVPLSENRAPPSRQGSGIGVKFLFYIAEMDIIS